MIKVKQQTEKEVGLSEYFPVTHLNEPTVFETRSGMQGIVLKLAGIPFVTQTNTALNLAKMRWTQALLELDEHTLIYVTLHRHRESMQLTGNFQNAFSSELDKRYHQQFADSALYVNDIYLTILNKGIAENSSIMKGFKKLLGHTIKGARETIRKEQTKTLKKVVYRLLDKLKSFNPRLLGEADKKNGYSELLSFLSLTINGGEKHHYRFPVNVPAFSKTVTKGKEVIALYPQGHLGQCISRKRIFFGSEHIQFEGNNKKERTFGAILVIKHYGHQTASIMLDTLTQLDSEFILTHQFAVADKNIALKRMKSHLIKLENADDPAVSQTEALHDARDSVASRSISMGYHQNTLLLLADSQLALENQVNQALKCYSDAGIVATKETLGLAPAFLAMLPGNIQFAKRTALISNENFADFAPLHNEKSGYRDNNHLGSAVTLLETPGKTPLFFNFHTQGSKDNPSSGHTVIIGGNNSGKTVLMGFMKCQLERYDGRSIIFDRNRGMEITVRATNGHYSIISPDFPETAQFNVFQLPDNPKNRQFCREHLCQLMRDEQQPLLSAEEEEWASNCVNYAYDTLSPEHRQLTNITKILPIDFSRWTSLRKWLRGEESAPDGEYAYLFDNQKDSLHLQTNMGFDMTHFLDHEPPQVLTTLVTYLFHRIEQSLDGRLMSLFLDEAWQYLDNSYFQTKLGKWLPTLRKTNCHLIFATQSPDSVVNSPISHIILDNSATQIFFANPQAKPDVYQKGFNLNDSEYGAIHDNLPESRLMLIKQGHDSLMAKLNLSPLPACLKVLSANEASVRKLDKIRGKVGDNPEAWLPVFLQERETKKEETAS